jgi:hypothetical protein
MRKIMRIGEGAIELPLEVIEMPQEEVVELII